MGKYIGRDNPYGLFEKQVLPADGTLYMFNLTYKAGTPSSLLVVSNGAVLQPDSDYTLDLGGTAIRFGEPPVGSLYVLYLGRELSVPVAQNSTNFSLLQQGLGDGTTTQFIMAVSPLTPTGILVLKNGQIQRYKNDDLSTRGDFTVAGNIVAFEVAPEVGDELDFYIFGTRANLALPDPGTITKIELANGSVTPEKMNLFYIPYIATISTFGGMVASNTQVFEAEYQDLGKLIKIRLHFSITLSGTPDNKIRFSIPEPNSGGTNVSGSVTLTSETSIETGIVKWGSESGLDIYRQFGVNYELGEWTVEVNLEYKSA